MEDDLLREKTEERNLFDGKKMYKAIISSILSTSPNDTSIGKKQFHRAENMYRWVTV